MAQSRRVLFVLGFAGWPVLWTGFYAIAHAVSPHRGLAEAILLVGAAILISLIAILVLLLTKRGWAALGYCAAMVLNGAGLLLVADFSYFGNYALAFAVSFPFFLPANFGP